MSDFEFKPNQKFLGVTISSIKKAKDTNTDVIFLQVYKNSPYKITFPLGLIEHCKTNAKFHPT